MTDITEPLRAALDAVSTKWKRHAAGLTQPDSDGDAPTEGDYGVARGLFACADELDALLSRVTGEDARDAARYRVVRQLMLDDNHPAWALDFMEDMTCSAERIDHALDMAIAMLDAAPPAITPKE